MNELYQTKQVTFGLNNENHILTIAQNVFSKDIKKSLYKFSKYDFFCNTTKFIFELKSRRITHDQYPTAIINKCKFIYPNMILIFSYLDGLFYINYDEELFLLFETKLQHINNYSQTQEVIHIPSKYLTKFSIECKIELTAKYDTTNFKKLVQQDQLLQQQLEYINN